MALKKLKSTVKPVDTSRPANKDVQYQEVTNEIDGVAPVSKTVGPEGGDVVFRGLEVPDNGALQGRILLRLVSETGQRTEVPAVTPWILKGADTLTPETPEPAEVTFEDDTADEGPAEPGGGTLPAEGQEGGGEPPAGAPRARSNPFGAPPRRA